MKREDLRFAAVGGGLAILVMAAFVLMAPGCQNGKSGNGNHDGATAVAAYNTRELDRAAQEAFRAARDYSRGHQDEAGAVVENNVERLGEQVQMLEDRVARDAGARPELRDAVRDLQDKGAAFQETLGEARASESRDWAERVKPEFDRRLDALEKAYDRVENALE